MRKGQLFVLSLLVFSAVSVLAAIRGGTSGERGEAFAGQDLHLQSGHLVSYQLSTGEHALVFQKGFSMSIGANRFSSNGAVVWLGTVTTEYRGRVRVDYDATVYLQGEIRAERAKAAKVTELSESVIEEGESMVVRFAVTGEVFATADRRKVADPRELAIYRKAIAAAAPVKPKFVVQPEALVPELPSEEIRPVVTKKPGLIKRLLEPRKKKVLPEVVEPEEEVAAKKPGFIEKLFGVRKEKVEAKPAKPKKAVVRRRAEFVKAVERKRIEIERSEEKKPRFVYPINIAPAGEVEPKIEKGLSAIEGRDIATVIGRFYLWQKTEDEEGREHLLELQADNAVIFYVGEELKTREELQAGPGDVLARGSVEAIYLCGDVVMTEGQRTVRADEMYYDFLRKKAIAVNAVMRTFDDERGIPSYVRAAKLHQIAENIFAAENATLTSSEFYLPQISVNASSVIITDTTEIDERLGKLSDSSYDAEMRNVRVKHGRNTIFYWPFVRSNLKKPDIPLKSIRAGYDSTWGSTVETRWYLARLLGRREPPDTDSTLAVDYYGKRGVGTGAEVRYTRQNYYGRVLGYIIRDTGEDKLGRHSSRQNLTPARELRGRFYWVHRHFLPYNWQLTSQLGYASDERFIEGYYRNEYNVGKQETYVHLKRIEDNWGVSFLGKVRINDFADVLEETPTAEYHLTGQSLFDDRFTLYSDTELGRLRQRIGKDHMIAIDGDPFLFASHRTELDLPIRSGKFKIVPYVAGVLGYDGRSGFTRTLVDGSNMGSVGEKNVWIGEAGVRVSMQPFWKVYPNVKSRLWDLNQLRHIVKPHLTAAVFTESDSVVEQRDTLSFGISQRLQTKRRAHGGSQRGEGMRTVDWMRLDTDFTWVSDPAAGGANTGPDRFIWNRPIVPLRVLSAPEIFSGDLINNLHRFEMYGPRRDYFSADYMWRLSDTSVILSDINYDIQDGVVQQYNVGLAHLRWPNLSLYIGSRYLRRIQILNETGSNAFTFAATYALDPRYMIVFAQQYDFDYGANIRSDITLIRRYHRLYWAITFSADESLDEQSIVFSIWPEGIKELAFGKRGHMELGRAGGY